jgi:large subunit ribosomal protein L28
MARQCTISGKRVSFGRNVSHSNRKSSRRFEPNLQQATLVSEALGGKVSLRLSTRALRSIQRRGGLDAFLLSAAEQELGPEGLRLQRRVRKAVAGRSKSAVAQ